MILSMSDSTSSPALKMERIGKLEKRSLPLVEINLCNLENEVRESSANTLDGIKSEHGLAFTVDVCVLDSENVGEFLSLNKVD